MDAEKLILSLTSTQSDYLSFSSNISESESEYFLRFCEINRNQLVDRVRRCAPEISKGSIVYRTLYLIFSRWEKLNDYRYLNVIFKFKRKGYFEFLTRNQEFIALRNKVERVLEKELGDGS